MNININLSNEQVEELTKLIESGTAHRLIRKMGIVQKQRYIENNEYLITNFLNDFVDLLVNPLRQDKNKMDERNKRRSKLFKNGDN